jgi:hypothetical protein
MGNKSSLTDSSLNRIAVSHHHAPQTPHARGAAGEGQPPHRQYDANGNGEDLAMQQPLNARVPALVGQLVDAPYAEEAAVHSRHQSQFLSSLRQHDASAEHRSVPGHLWANLQTNVHHNIAIDEMERSAHYHGQVATTAQYQRDADFIVREHLVDLGKMDPDGVRAVLKGLMELSNDIVKLMSSIEPQVGVSTLAFVKFYVHLLPNSHLCFLCA